LCMVWTLFIASVRGLAKRQTAGIKFTHRPKISFFAPRRGDSLHRFWPNFAGPTGTWVRLIVQNLSSVGAGSGNAARKYQKFPLFGKESPRMGDSLDQSLKLLGALICLAITHQCFKFDVIRVTGFGVIAEKPRVGQLRRIFPCTL